MITTFRTSILAALIAFGSFCATAAYAGTQIVYLVESTLVNVPDVAGISQYEGGNLQNASSSSIGTYMIVRRFVPSAGVAYNTNAATITLFLAPSTSGGNAKAVTLEGSWSDTTGDFVGSVSATSGYYHWLIGAEASSTLSGLDSKLVLIWTGSDYLQL
jgi:hypothetical protein